MEAMMGSYNVGNLLEMIAPYASDGSGDSYVVKKRPLNFQSGEAAHKASPVLRHEHFVHKNGVKNFGFGENGVFMEAPSDLGKYKLTSEYGLKQYDAGMLDALLKKWHEKNDAIDEVVEALDLQEEVPPNYYRDYSLGLNDCQSFIRDFDYRYNLEKAAR